MLPHLRRSLLLQVRRHGIATAAALPQLSQIVDSLPKGIDPVELEKMWSDSRKKLETLGNFDQSNALAFTRERLLATQLEGVRGVLFLCGHNAGRSQVAAALLADKIDREKLPLVAFSGGSTPLATVNPVVVEAMKEIGIDMSAAFPKPWTQQVAAASDVIVTMGCGDRCPVLPGQECINWDLPDPHGEGIQAVRQIRDKIIGNIDELVKELVPESSS